MERDVLIAGAGPTGLTLACGLLANGVAARVVDKAAGPAETSRALGLQPRGIEVVERLGALNGLPERALQVEQIVVHINGKQAATVRVGRRTALVTRPGLVISQAEVEAELRRRVAELGGRDRLGPRGGRGRAGFARRHACASRTVARAGSAGSWGATGRTAACANWPASASPGCRSPSASCSSTSTRTSPCHGSSIYVWLDGDSVFGAFPLPGQDLWRLMAPAADPGSEADLVTDEAVLAEVARLLRERTGCDPSLIRDPEWVTSFRIHRRLADTYRNGRILLAGDAAHVHSPFGGQGMNTGIGDAENLAWKLAMVVNATAEPELLDSYEAERRPIAADVLKWTGAAGNLILGNHVLARLLRDRVIVPLMNTASMQRRVWENLSQLKVSYRDGPLGRRRAGGSPATIRCPATACRTSSAYGPKRGRTTLHAELGNRWALVMPGRTASDEYAAVVAERLEDDGMITLVADRERNLVMPGRTVRDEYAAVVAKRLGDDGVVTLVADHPFGDDIMLVRPDAHLLWRGRADLDAVERCLIAMAQHGRAG